MQKIAICDSGVGGLFLLDKMVKKFSNYTYLYLCDRDNLPYGNKSESQIKSYCENFIFRAEKLGADFLIVACNTMGEYGEDIFENKAKIPVFFVRHNLRKILASNLKESMFFCTEATAKSAQFRAISRLDKNFVFPLKSLAEEIEKMAENLEFFTPDFLQKSNEKIKKVYLGCTHYNLILNKFKVAFPNAEFFDGSESVISFFTKILSRNNHCINPTKRVFEGSGNLAVLRAYKKNFTV